LQKRGKQRTVQANKGTAFVIAWAVLMRKKDGKAAL